MSTYIRVCIYTANVHSYAEADRKASPGGKEAEAAMLTPAEIKLGKLCTRYKI